VQAGVFEQFIGNPTCRHIIFGACHDNGYVRVLEKYEADAVTKHVTLLHSFDTAREFSSLNFLSIKMETIFRTSHVVRYKSPPLLMRQIAQGRENVHVATNPTWAARLAATGGTNGVAVSRRFMDLPPGAVLLNAAGQRVDTELHKPPLEALNSWQHKIKKARMRYCRLHHLRPSGCKGGCGYCHGLLSEEEILAFRHDLRLERCHAGLRCRDAKCFYGHNCSCEKHGCNFSREMHNVDVTTVHVLSGP
jgi:hypothetical protein